VFERKNKSDLSSFALRQKTSERKFQKYYYTLLFILFRTIDTHHSPRNSFYERSLKRSINVPIESHTMQTENTRVRFSKVQKKNSTNFFFYNLVELISKFFVKHDLKGLLNCIGVEICTHSPPPSPHRP
jgi:hypothetical protein